jgi:hypothetical protein
VILRKVTLQDLMSIKFDVSRAHRVSGRQVLVVRLCSVCRGNSLYSVEFV